MADLEVINYEGAKAPKILIVDDEPSLQTVMIDTLEADYRLVSAYNGKEGVAMASQVSPDLILMDAMMPDLGGLDAVRLLNADPATRTIPVIVVSAHGNQADVIQSMVREPNVVGVLSKPFKPKGLREIVRAALEKRIP